MKMRKKLAALLAAAMIASVMPMTAFAASTNRVTKTVTIEKDTVIGENAPELVIDLKDDLKKDQAFYLELENAEWKEEKDGFKWADVTSTPSAITFKRVDKKTLEVKAANGDVLASGADIMVPLYAKATGGDATVIIDSYGTVVNSGKYVFAVSEDSKADVKVADAKTFVDSGSAAKITLEESYAGAFNKNKVQDIVIELDDDKFSFTDLGKLVGKRGFDTEKTKLYDGQPVKEKDGEINPQKVKFTIGANDLANLQRGIFEIEGLKIEADRKALEGDVTAYVSADFINNATVTLAKYGDYSVDLTTKEVKEFVAGNNETVKFQLEQVGDAINANRRTTLIFSKDIVVKEIVKAGVEDKGSIMRDKNEVVIPAFTSEIKDNKIEFEVKLDIPAKFEGDLFVTVEGRSIGEDLEVKLAEVKAPVTVEVEAMSIKAGTRENKGGKITITETDKKMINRGTLVIQLPKDLKDDGVDFEKVKDLKIETTGGIKTDKASYNATASAIEINVTRQSTEAGSIEISGFQVKAKRAIIDGAYEVEIGGKAISEIADLALNDKDEYKKVDAITSADFLLVGDVFAKAEVVFNIGSDKLVVNGKEVTMDAAAYIKDGRTMVPLRYLSYALGIDEDSIKFNSGIVTIFAEDGKVIQVANGSKNLLVNGMTIPMVASAEIVEGRTYVPVTEIGGVFGVTGTWDAVAQTATFK